VPPFTPTARQTSAQNRLELVCIYGTAKRSVTVKRTYTLERVLQRMEDEYVAAVHQCRVILTRFFEGTRFLWS
jgi:hypothetical protein